MLLGTIEPEQGDVVLMTGRTVEDVKLGEQGVEEVPTARLAAQEGLDELVAPEHAARPASLRDAVGVQEQGVALAERDGLLLAGDLEEGRGEDRSGGIEERGGPVGAADDRLGVARVDVVQFVAVGMQPGGAERDEPAGVEVAEPLADPADDGAGLEVVDVRGAEAGGDQSGHHRRRGAVAHHVGDQEGGPAVEWLHPRGDHMADDDWSDPDLRLTGMRLQPAFGPAILIIVNAGDDGEFALPDGEWSLRIDTARDQVACNEAVSGVLPLGWQSVVALTCAD